MSKAKAIKTINRITGKYKKLADKLSAAAGKLHGLIDANNAMVAKKEDELKTLRDEVAADNRVMAEEAAKAQNAAESIKAMVGEAA